MRDNKPLEEPKPPRETHKLLQVWDYAVLIFFVYKIVTLWTCIEQHNFHRAVIIQLATELRKI